jgi:Trk K+ transport system NAD-binding subunit
MLLMIMGNAGIVTVMASLILGFVDTAGSREAFEKIGFLVIGLLVLLWMARSKWVERRLNRLIRKALERWTDLDVRDYASLFKLKDGYSVSELGIRAGEWLADRSLSDLALTAEGVLVLGVRRADGTYEGAPRGDSVVSGGDYIIAYGRSDRLKELDRRARGAQGDEQHAAAVREHALLVGRG